MFYYFVGGRRTYRRKGNSIKRGGEKKKRGGRRALFRVGVGSWECYRSEGHRGGPAETEGGKAGLKKKEKKTKAIYRERI